MAELIKETIAQPQVLRLLRCQKTNRYFTGDGWSEDPQRAKNYADEIEAARACVEHDLTHVDLVLRAAGAQGDIFITPVR